ncbi:winged helix-turn-helix transcriptional regulator [Fictibacillus barbaricus]|uniref:Helix-turn-helix transcriptional regulator n=1 Tax=Fictibacillus barbaricus TaxID=182136 RepID=A0ABS2ZBU9_9BACL|nr:helix-turn-helix domain-containing protein [Fictibacillus barbaricus]MBN3544106.1 helix-turn-helix transcriptional regulator [Fictibacillus barbaricus]GGB68981.1 hypothetical protein GCM10007199_38960 [Fictibacillus barbaricus]
MKIRNRKTIKAGLVLIEKKWTSLIIIELMEGPIRFKALAKRIPEMSEKMLAQRLRELNSLSIIERHVSKYRPLKVEYKLTQKGLELAVSLNSFSQWTDKWM